MILLIILFLLSFALFYFGGYLRGLFECVLLFDSVDDWFGPFWAFDAFTEGKDRNKDGKVSFWELNFPKDGGHRAKLYELSCYAFGAAILALANSFSPFPAWYVLALAVPIWWVNSVGFLTSFNKFRKAK
jgi:hypothetical protein